ncbi:MAG: hypothetical protein ACO1SX_05125 [Actinomycetota bacterium]
MSLVQPAPEPRRVRLEDPRVALTPPIVPRLREHRVVPLHEHRKVRLLRAAFYVVCFMVGIAAGLIAARLMGAPTAGGHGERAVVTIRTLSR